MSSRRMIEAVVAVIVLPLVACVGGSGLLWKYDTDWEPYRHRVFEAVVFVSVG